MTGNFTRMLMAAAAVLAAGLTMPAAAEEPSLRRNLDRMLEDTARNLEQLKRDLMRDLDDSLESFMDEDGNIVIERHWEWGPDVEPEPHRRNPFEDPYEEPFGGVET
jgi:hypothetical protein